VDPLNEEVDPLDERVVSLKEGADPPDGAALETPEEELSLLDHVVERVDGAAKLADVETFELVMAAASVLLFSPLLGGNLEEGYAYCQNSIKLFGEIPLTIEFETGVGPIAAVMADGPQVQ
jgi:hypothetical protein